MPIYWFPITTGGGNTITSTGTLPCWFTVTTSAVNTATTYIDTMGFQTNSITGQNFAVMMAQQYAQQYANQAQAAMAQQPTAEQLHRPAGGWNERARRDAEQRQAATAKARELLLRHLTAEQRATFERNRWFVVEGGHTKKRYRINANGSVAGNIEELDANDRAVARLCAHADQSIPADDQYLGQKLMLECDEEHFLRQANRR